jgi:hypothetical protein
MQSRHTRVRRNRFRQWFDWLLTNRGAAPLAIAVAAFGAGCSAPAGPDEVRVAADAESDGEADVAEPSWNLDSARPDTTPIVDSAPADVCAKTVCSDACIDTSSDPKNCGACGHDCLGGACTGGVCQSIVISAGGAQVMDLRMDDTNVYWFEKSGCIGCERLMRAPRDGSTAPTVLAVDQKSPDALTPRTAGLYWTEPTEGTIRSIYKTGAGLTTVMSGQDYPSFLAFADDEMYWANYGRNKLTESLWRRPASSSSIKLASTSGPIVIDDSYVYWLEWAVYPSDQGSIRRVSKSGTGETTLTPLKGSIYLWLQMIGSDLYWRVGNDLLRMPKTGGTPAKVAVVDGWHGLILKDDGIYDSLDGKSVTRVPLGGGPAVKLLEDLDFWALRDVDAKTIAYVTHSGSTYASGFSIKLRAK